MKSRRNESKVNEASNMSDYQRFPRLLSDQPVFEDRFRIHTKLAEQLKWLIENITQNGTGDKKNIVALFGTWGSGKSTVINILEDLLGNEYKVIRYDSWSHRDDHLKKAFLLQLMDSLEFKEIKYRLNRKDRVKSNKDSEIRLQDLILGKVRKQEIERIPTIHVNTWLFIVGTILFLGAVSISILNILKLLRPKSVGSWDLISYFSQLPSWLSIILALLAIVTIAILWKLRDYIAYSLYAPFLKIPISVNEVVLSHREIEIPSIQFQEYFRYILSKWKEKHKEKLVIVLDNLDRVSDEMVSRFFSLIQSALDALESINLREQVVFIVPIDKERVLQVLGGMIRSGDTQQSGSSDSGSFEKDFLKKLFPYAVEIPDLMDSNWRVFFKTKLLQVFPWMEKAHAESGLITGIFHQGISQTCHRITPREIIHFINEMAVHAWTYRSVRSRDLTSTDIVLIALYAAITRYDAVWSQELFGNNRNNRNNLQDTSEKELSTEPKNRSFLKSMANTYVGTLIPQDYHIKLLQLHYRTTDVLDLLLIGPLLDILAEGGEKAEEIIKSQIETKLAIFSTEQKQIFLKEILEKTLQENNTELSMSPVKIGRFIWILQQLELYNEGFQLQLWALLQSSVQQESLELKTLDMTAKEGLLYILSKYHPEKSTVIQSLARHFVSVLDEFVESEEGSA